MLLRHRLDDRRLLPPSSLLPTLDCSRESRFLHTHTHIHTYMLCSAVLCCAVLCSAVIPAVSSQSILSSYPVTACIHAPLIVWVGDWLDTLYTTPSVRDKYCFISHEIILLCGGMARHAAMKRRSRLERGSVFCKLTCI